MKFISTVITIAMVGLAAYGIIRISVNLTTKGNPPLVCQFIGGTWNIWDGWNCNGSPAQQQDVTVAPQPTQSCISRYDPNAIDDGMCGS